MPSTIRSHFGEEHAHLDREIERLLDSVEGADRDALVADWARFERALLAHLEAEERFLLPTVRTTAADAVARVERDHGQIRALLDQLGTEAELHTLRKEEASDFTTLLRAHAAFEDVTLYRFADERLEADDREGALERPRD